MKSYVSNTTINFEGFKFYVRPGDILVHDARNHNSLSVYRNGQLVKVVKQDPLAIEAFVKSKFIVEVQAPPPPPKKEPPIPPASVKKQESIQPDEAAPPFSPACASTESPTSPEFSEFKRLLTTYGSPKPEPSKLQKGKPPKPVILPPVDDV